MEEKKPGTGGFVHESKMTAVSSYKSSPSWRICSGVVTAGSDTDEERLRPRRAGGVVAPGTVEVAAEAIMSIC